MDQLNNNIQTPELDIFITDLNGNQRGKRVPVTSASKILKEGFKMPRSVFGLDFWGEDVEGTNCAFEEGYSDGLCQIVSPKLVPVPWKDGDHYQLMAMMRQLDGSNFVADPRQLLESVLQTYKAKGLTPVVAVELEFYLLDLASEQACRPIASSLLPKTGFNAPNPYALHNLDRFTPILEDIRYSCGVQEVPADSIISEFGDGQFEVNLNHVDDALLAADHAVMFKRIVRNVAYNHEHLASFMAKPYGDKIGSGMHVHFSVLDDQGKNIFSDGTSKGSSSLLQAVAGLLQAMQGSMLMFAPHLNSWRRLRPRSCAPIAANWGYENRTVSVRIPDSPDEARRIEHRVSGADANPYLVIAAILSAALYGIEHKLAPCTASTGNTYANPRAEQALPTQWYEAIYALRTSTLMRELLGDAFVDLFTAIKEQELDKFASRITDAEYETYLGVV
ncbi:MAG TPA: glutamine synthetase family protein [Thiolinea sp.]|nr:glutamine synthetase family protein [Thiolinea sp.]